jgi:hypothetical protein
MLGLCSSFERQVSFALSKKTRGNFLWIHTRSHHSLFSTVLLRNDSLLHATTLLPLLLQLPWRAMHSWMKFRPKIHFAS